MAGELTGAQRRALEVLAPAGRVALGVSVYQWESSNYQPVAWIHPSTLANIEKRGFVRVVDGMDRYITDAGREALERSGGDGD